MEITVGITCFNEEENIARLLDALLNQRTQAVRIRKIIVVSSGSTDRTDEIVRQYDKAKLIVQKRRKGKASAIRAFLKAAKTDIVVLESGDTIPDPDAIEQCCLPLNNPDVGIVAARPYPHHAGNYLSSVISLQWALHHELSLLSPKYGELIAFRKVISTVPDTAVDEEKVAQLILSKGLAGAYAPKACVSNKGPSSIPLFVRQRRRIHCGHLQLRNETSYEASSLSATRTFKALMKVMWSYAPWTLAGAALLEGYARVLGYKDYLLGRDHAVWEVAR
jgi:cellulose synthase/poly-beta-1,6-N-acetylglucosamine synthase-like glycosyltransferase